MRFLVLGHAGFLGKHLVRALREDYEVFGLDLTTCGELPPQQEAALDICNTEAVMSWVVEHPPHVIINCVGKFGNEDLPALLEINCLAPLRIVKAMRGSEADCRIVLIGSAAEYGLTPGAEPLNESTPIAPASEYGLSKAAQTFCARMESVRGGVDVVLARPFNLLGPGLSPQLFFGSMVAQLRGIEAGKCSPVIKVGNLKTARDFLRIDDAARMLAAIALKGASGEEYNLCSGRAMTTEALLKMLIQASGLEVRLEQDPARVRRIDPPVVVGDVSKVQELHKALDARPIDPEFVAHCYHAT